MKHLVTTVAILAITMVACGESTQTDPSGRTWQLVELDGEAPLESTIIDLTISDDIVSGSAGCNTYNGTATVSEDGSMTLGPQFAITFRACDQPIMDQEQEYLDALSEVVSYRATDDELLLEGESGALLAKFE